MKSNESVSFHPGISEYDTDTPALISFPFGVPSSDAIQLQAFEKSTSKKRKYIIEGDLSGVTFQSCNYGVSNSSNDFTGFSIGVYDEKTGVIEIHSAGHAFAMEQQIDKDDVPAALSASSMTAMQRRQSLTDTFGSKKKKRALRAAESNIISSQNIVAADTISGMLSDSVIKGERETASAAQLEDGSCAPKSAMEQHRETMLPPFDSMATSLKEAYPLGGGLVPRHMMHVLQEWTECVSAQLGATAAGGSGLEWEDKFISSPQTVRDLFEQNISHLKDKKFKKDVGYLMLCEAMMRVACLLSESSKPVMKEALEERLGAPPAPLLRHLTDNFAVFKKSFGKHAFVSTKSLVDKLLMHIMVLILHLNNGVVNLATFAADVQVGAARTSALAKEVGCRLVHGSKSEGRSSKDVTAQVVLPLKFPEHRKGQPSSR